MITVSAEQACRRFKTLLESASRGERVIVTRKGKPVAELGPVDTQDADDSWALTDEEAEKLEKLIAKNEAAGKTRTYASVREMVEDVRKRLKIPKKVMKR